MNERYGVAAALLHWLLAVTILALYALGWYMVTIPKGTLSVCSHNGSPPRVDTRLTLHIVQKLIILGPDNKSITLQAGAPVFIGNVPLSFARTGIPTPKAHEHYKKYCEMVGDTL